MKLKIIIVIGLLCGIAMAQTTPNLNFNIPAQGTPNWGPLINANFSALDSMLSGLTALPKLNTTNGYQVGGVTAIDSTRNGFLVNLTVSGTCTGCGTAGAVTSVGATSPVLSSGGSTPTISISGVTALQGNGSKLQLATGTTTTGHFPSYDASGNLVDSTQPSGGAMLPSNAVVYGLTAITSRAATFTDVVALWTSCGTNFLKGNGTCAAAGGTPAGTTNDVQINLGGSFGVDTGVFTYTPSTHILNAGQGITTTSSGVATILGLSGGTTPGSFPTNSFGWLGPNNATFTSYFLQCPTTPPTNGQTIIFGTQVGSIVPCTFATPAGGSGGVAFQLLVAVCQLTAGKSINGSFPTANAPTPDCVSGTATTPQSGRALFSQISLAATPNQWVDQQFILPNPLTGTYSLVVKVQNDVVTSGTDYVSFQYVCAADTATALPTYASVQSFSVAVPGTANTYATITATPTVASCSAGNVLYTRLGVVSGSGSPTTNNLAIHSATLFVK